jgi:hypothetical protein
MTMVNATSNFGILRDHAFVPPVPTTWSSVLGKNERRPIHCPESGALNLKLAECSRRLLTVQIGAIAVDELAVANFGCRTCCCRSCRRVGGRMNGCSWPGAAVPNISRKPPMENLVSAKVGTTPQVSTRPEAAIDVLASNRSLQHPFSDSIGARSGLAVTSGAPFPGARLGPAAERP